jgi:hypothetical protein
MDGHGAASFQIEPGTDTHTPPAATSGVAVDAACPTTVIGLSAIAGAYPPGDDALG